MFHMKKEGKLPRSAVVNEMPVAYRVSRGGAGLVKAIVAGAGEPGSGTLIGALKTGLAFRELEDLRDLIDLPMDRLAQHLCIPRATLHRRRLAGRLDSAESDRILRFARLLGQATATLEDPAAARAWLASPQVGLGGEAPLVYAETEVGAREVEALLGRIEYGVYA